MASLGRGWRRCCSWRAASGSPGLGALRGPPESRGWPATARPSAGSRGQMPNFSLVRCLLSFPNKHSISRFHHTTLAVGCYSKTQSGEKYADPFKLGRRDLTDLYEDIKKELLVSTRELKEMCEYYFDGRGKAFRPIVVVLMARACNVHHNNCRDMQASQRTIALIAEMIHTASLVHDDIIDDASSRRGKHTVNQIWGEKKVSILGCPDPAVHEIAYQYGKNIGIAFQLIDDVLDFTSCTDQLGKPAASDLKLGLATGPVLFACQQFPEMNAMIMRRFSLPGDVERAWQYVLQSDGVQQTTYLAQQYCHKAIREISKLRPSPERDALIQLTEIVLTRDK
ncbi:all trans-polyprenyl-diphosphate synthase PDSS1 isoform X4 [Dromiciops gliroides]|uniref:all trans-polyprenyl-diphosphate synthase PDSS1 isoform X4 n=1 Tax=Dromiciops gliroides TaxID=33562 RepID=UPI001CC58933|nr:all trans-polyprenyl-diphosphate synthase PDSS1 isoform X4 [Dromiciops gliroides]